MPSAIRERWEIFRDVSGRPWFRVLGLIWFLVGAWDLILSQFVPEQYSRYFPKLYQAIGMTAGWLPFGTWLVVGALVLVAGAIEWAFRHKKRYLELLHRGQTESGDQANFRGIVGGHPLIRNPSDMPVGTPVSPVVARYARSPSLTINEEWSVEQVRWSQLYDEYDVDTGKELRLRFLPDTNDQVSDALLLICYGYKVIRNVDSIMINFVHDQIEYLLQHAPNTQQLPLSRMMMSLSRSFGERWDFGQKPVGAGDIERVGLSRGGEYRFTRSGENKADSLARDLSKRA
jgi:hypothetical protein